MMKHEKYEVVDQFPLGAGCAPGGDTTRDHGVFALPDHTGGDGGRGVRAQPRGVALSLDRDPGLPRRVFTDAAGVVWQTRSITEADAAVSIFTMIFVSVLS